MAINTPENRASHRYALHYIGPRLQKTDSYKSPHATRLSKLSEVLQIFDGDKPWGTLGQWTRTSAHTRPSIAIQMMPIDDHNQPDEKKESYASGTGICLLKEMLHEVLSNFGVAELEANGTVSVMIRPTPWYKTKRTVRIEKTISGLAFALDPESDLVRAVLDKKNKLATRLLVFECCRILGAEFSDDSSLHTVHQFINARPA